VSTVSVVVVSHNVRAHLERCLGAFADSPHELIVVDSLSADGSPELVRSRFPNAGLIQLERNEGYGAAANAGMRAASGDHFLVMNPDAWPVGDAVARLASFADGNERIGVVGPRLLNPDGSLQPSLRGFPTLWRLATEYLFLRRFAPRSRLLNAFYGANFDYRTVREAEFLMGAVLLFPRSAIDEVGGFDPAFFMFSEEVDLCYRMREAGWRVVFFPDAEFVHVGGASTSLDWAPMYREQIRGHLLFFAKHHGRRRAEQVRRLLVWAFRLRSLVFRGERRRLTRETRRWLSSGGIEALLARPASRPSSP
jgi:N-acetylglucosaminyl-diphospho-decaprenol L-rhamnosyltransferase